MYPNSGPPNQFNPYQGAPYGAAPMMPGQPQPQPGYQQYPQEGFPQMYPGQQPQMYPQGQPSMYPPGAPQMYPTGQFQPGQPQAYPPQMYPGPAQGYQDYSQNQNFQQVPYQQQPNYQMPPPQQPYMAPPVDEPQYESEEEENESESDDDEEEYASDGEWELFRGTPTVYAEDPFDPVADAAILRKAMKGFGTDEDALIKVLCNRTSEQRQEIAEAYEKAYGKPLVDRIKSETGGKFEQLLVALLTPLPEFYCRELKEPLSAKKVLVEVLCSLYNWEIDAVKECFNRMNGQELEAAILGDSDSNTFQTLMIALCAAERDESGEIFIDAAKEDANNLIESDDIFEYDGIFHEMLCNRSYDQLRTILREYQMIVGKSFLKLIKKCFSGDEKTGMMYIFRCLNNKADFFAHQLHDAMEGLGTNDTKLIRLIVTRCEIDMVEIKGAFQRLFGKSLKDFIKGDCSGDYKHALYALIGEQRS